MKILANAMIPLLGILLLYAGRRRSREVLVRVTVALAWAYVLHFLDRALAIWDGHLLDYSTHTAVAIAIGATLARLGRGWAVATIAIWVAYAALMVHARYHPLDDILTTAAVNLPVAIGAQFLPRRRRAAEA